MRFHRIGWVLTMALAFLAVPAQADEFTVRIQGSEGVAYVGRYVLVREDGSRSSGELTGVAPRVFWAKGTCLALTLGKTSPGGEIRARIMRGNRVVAKGGASGSAGRISLWAGASGADCRDLVAHDWRQWPRKFGDGWNRTLSDTVYRRPRSGT